MSEDMLHTASGQRKKTPMGYRADESTRLVILASFVMSSLNELKDTAILTWSCLQWQCLLVVPILWKDFGASKHGPTTPSQAVRDPIPSYLAAYVSQGFIQQLGVHTICTHLCQSIHRIRQPHTGCNSPADFCERRKSDGCTQN